MESLVAMWTNVSQITGGAIKTLSVSILRVLSSAYAMLDSEATVTSAMILTNALKTRRCVRMDSASIFQDHSNATVKWDSCIPISTMSKHVLISMNVTCSVTCVFMVSVKMCSVCSDASVITDTILTIPAVIAPMLTNAISPTFANLVPASTNKELTFASALRTTSW